jgi:hypothetical protein
LARAGRRADADGGSRSRRGAPPTRGTAAAAAASRAIDARAFGAPRSRATAAFARDGRVVHHVPITSRVARARLENNSKRNASALQPAGIARATRRATDPAARRRERRRRRDADDATRAIARSRGREDDDDARRATASVFRRCRHHRCRIASREDGKKAEREIARRRTRLSACSASFALYTRSGRESPERSSGAFIVTHGSVRCVRVRAGMMMGPRGSHPAPVLTLSCKNKTRYPRGAPRRADGLASASVSRFETARGGSARRFFIGRARSTFTRN